MRAAVANTKTGLDDRRYIGILGLKNNEPGTLLDGTAEALKVFLAVDLARIPNVIVLDREHLQYLQTEKALTGMELQLKSSALVIDGGLQFEPGQANIRISILLRPLAAGRRPEKIEVVAPKADLKNAREQITKLLGQRLNAEMVREDPASARSEGELFLRQVPLYLFSGDLQTAVSQAEVAYALLSNQEARYLAAWAWYALGWDLVNKAMPATFQPRRMAARDIGDQFTAGNTRVRRIDSERQSGQVRTISRARQAQPPSRKVQSQSVSRRVAPQEVPADPDLKQKKIRYLSALIRSYSLMEEMTRIHIRDYESGLQKNIALRDPRDHFDDVSRQH